MTRQVLGWLILSLVFCSGSDSNSWAEECNLVENFGEYSLYDSLMNRRSRRFFKSAKMPGGPIKYDSEYKPESLTLEEEAILVFAGVGINGYALAELPYHEGPDGHGQMMIQFSGRTAPSGDAGHFASMIVINDDGVWYVKRPQDLSPEEIEEVVAHYSNKNFVEAYKILRVQLAEKRPQIPRETTNMIVVNKWSTNYPGTTYFIPIIDFSYAFLTSVFYYLNPAPELSILIADEMKNFKPAGLKAFTKSKGGFLEDDPKSGKIVPMHYSEFLTAQLMAVEVGAITQNMYLASQALGLGGWVHSAGVAGSWGGQFGLQSKDYPVSRFLGLSKVLDPILKLIGQDNNFKSEYGLHAMDGTIAIKTFTPEYYGSVENAVRAYVDLKFGPSGKYSDRTGAWKDSKKVKSEIPDYPEEQIEAAIAHVEYVYKTYGRYPRMTGPLGYNVAYQAHVIDPDFYDEFYQDSAITNTQRCRSGKRGEK